MINFHWVVADTDGLVFGGLHNSKGEARRAKVVLMKAEENLKYSPKTSAADIDKMKKNNLGQLARMQVTFLQQSHRYKPFGLEYGLVHGINDGTHGAGSKERTNFILQKAVPELAL